MAWVQLFENCVRHRWGARTPIPTGSLYERLPSPLWRRSRVAREPIMSGQGAALLAVVRDQEAEGPRSVLVTEGWVSWVPFWARWPYEVPPRPRRNLASLPGPNGR